MSERAVRSLAGTWLTNMCTNVREFPAQVSAKTFLIRKQTANIFIRIVQSFSPTRPQSLGNWVFYFFSGALRANLLSAHRFGDFATNKLSSSIIIKPVVFKHITVIKTSVQNGAPQITDTFVH